MKLSVGVWMVCDSIGVTMGKVVYLDQDILVVRLRPGTSTMMGRHDLVYAVGDREKMLALMGKIDAMTKRKNNAIVAHRVKINRIEEDHRRAVRRMLPHKSKPAE